MAKSPQKGLLLGAWKSSFEAMKSLSTFVPFLIYAGFQGLLLVSLVYFVYPPFSAIWVPLTRALFGDRALHYPNNYIVLAPLFDWSNVVLSGLVGALVVGVATYLFGMRYNAGKPDVRVGIRRTIHKYFMLFGVWAVETALILIAVVVAPLAIGKMFNLGYTQGRMVEYAGLVLAVGVGALFAYTTALIVLSGKGLFTSIKESVSLFARNPLATLLLVAVPTAVRFPFEYLSGKAPVLISRFSPEIMIAVLSAGIFVSFFANYVLVGSVTFYFLGKNAKA